MKCKALTLYNRFQSAGPPSATLTSGERSQGPSTVQQHPEDATSLLASDFALQRLIAESHLLSASSTTTGSSSNRHATTAMRLAALGAAPAKPQRMPMAQRQGIERKNRELEQGRRAEAKESGTVLERKGGKERERKGRRSREREREVGGPSVGRWKGGTLVLGKKDVQAIRGSGATRGKTGKRRR